MQRVASGAADPPSTLLPPSRMLDTEDMSSSSAGKTRMLDTEDMLSSSAGETAEGVEGALLVQEPAERGASADQRDETELRPDEAGEIGAD